MRGGPTPSAYLPLGLTGWVRVQADLRGSLLGFLLFWLYFQLLVSTDYQVRGTSWRRYPGSSLAIPQVQAI